MEEKSVLTGTISEMISMGLTVNGHVVDTAQLSVLTRLFGNPIDKAPKPEPKVPRKGKGSGGGRRSTIWELNSEQNLDLDVSPRFRSLMRPPGQPTKEQAPTQATNEDAAPNNAENDKPKRGRPKKKAAAA